MVHTPFMVFHLFHLHPREYNFLGGVLDRHASPKASSSHTQCVKVLLLCTLKAIELTLVGSTVCEANCKLA